MNLEGIFAVCDRLTNYQLRAFWPLTGNTEEPRTADVSGGVALLYWTADWLTGLTFLDQDRVRLIVEAFANHLLRVGTIMGDAWHDPTKFADMPRIRIGFLDRQLVVVDGCDFFLNLDTGQHVDAVRNLRPHENISYDLGITFAMYGNQDAYARERATPLGEALTRIRSNSGGNDCGPKSKTQTNAGG